MKELSIEEKAKAYDEAKARMSRAYNDNRCSIYFMNEIFPELKESEDERIRQMIINTLNRDEILTEDETYDCLAWLEKQSEQPQGKSALEAVKEEKVDNQNCVKLADKVEPKFKNGQWIVWKEKCYKINYNGCGYELVDQDGLSMSLEYGTINEGAHLWSIQDANDGDVLVDKNGCINIYKEPCDKTFYYSHGYCYYPNHGYMYEKDGKFVAVQTAIKIEDANPATKEQRDTLMKAMTDAGYTFDFEKKRLKKIEQESTDEDMKEALRTEYEKGRADAIAEMQKAWSEEDEEELDIAVSTLKEAGQHDSVKWLKFLKDRVQPKQEWSKEDETHINSIIDYLRDYKLFVNEEYINVANGVQEEIDWLKSLKPQNIVGYNPYKEIVDSIAEMCKHYENGKLKKIGITIY